VARRVPPELLLVGTVLLWSFNYTAVRYGVTHGFRPLSYAPLRWSMAAVALVTIARRRGQSLRIGRCDFTLLAAVSVVGIVCNQVTLLYALHLAPASTVALVFGMLPVLISLLSQFAGVEHLMLRHWVATGVSFLGVVLVSLGTRGGLGGDLGGVLLALLTVCSFAVYSVSIVPVMRRNSPLVVAAVTTAIGAFLLVIVTSPALAEQDWGRPSSLAWAALVYSALPSIVLGNILWFTAISQVGPGRAGLYSNLQPFLAAVFAVLVLSERLGAWELAGGFVIAAGLVLGRRRPLAAPPVE
jgi:drug/metabolite transporter (DMT)-like permease